MNPCRHFRAALRIGGLRVDRYGNTEADFINCASLIVVANARELLR